MSGARRPLVEVEGLAVAYRHGAGWRRAVEGVSFSIGEGEALGLVGESGSGKSTVALQLLGYRHPSLRVAEGAVRLGGAEVTRLGRPALDRLRGRVASFVPQNPTTALNPGRRVGEQVAEMRSAHGLPPAADEGDAFARVGLPRDAGFRRRYPHQLSGGQQQRVCIAMALACEPRLVVLDEPTTGLDVTTQAQIVRLLAELRARTRLAMLYVTHDLAVLSHLADRIGVMYAGRLVEVAPTAALFRAPRHPYTQGLVASLPSEPEAERFGGAPLRGLLRREALPPGCPFAPRCDHALERCREEVQALEPVGPDQAAACWRWREVAPEWGTTPPAGPRGAAGGPAVLEVRDLFVAYGRAAPVVREVSFSLGRGETLALVGESGSGKSTIARALAGLVAPASGQVALGGRPLAALAAQRGREELRRLQLVFQNPDASLNPRARIAGTLRRPLDAFFGGPSSGGTARARVAQALADVRLDAGYADRFPDQLSGGERQRVAIARALLARPDVLLCDEVLSALDVSVQASVLDLLRGLARETGVAMLFISHDLAVVRLIADRVLVLFGGEVVEAGPAPLVFAPPVHPFTAALLDAAPRALRPPRGDALPVARGPAPPSGRGCVYAGRCAWKVGPVCDAVRPPAQDLPGGHVIRCHHGPQALADLWLRPRAEAGALRESA